MSRSCCTRYATAGCRTWRATLLSLLVGPRLLFCILSLSSRTSQDSPWQKDRKCHTKRDKRQSLSRNGYRYDAYCSICFIPPLVPQHPLRPSPHTTIPPLRPPPHHRPYTPLLRPFTSHSLTGAPPSPPIQLQTPSRNTSFTNIYVLQLCRLYPHSTSLSSTANTVPLYFRPLSSTPYRPTPLQSSAVSSVQLN